MSANALVYLLIVFLIIALIAGILVWIVRTAPFIAEPFKSWACWGIGAVAALIMVLKLLPLVS